MLHGVAKPSCGRLDSGKSIDMGAGRSSWHPGQFALAPSPSVIMGKQGRMWGGRGMGGGRILRDLCRSAHCNRV